MNWARAAAGLAIIAAISAMIGAAMATVNGTWWAVFGVPTAPALGVTVVLWIYERWGLPSR